MGSVRYDFEGEAVVVTGGSSGIGRAIALGFAEVGASVVSADLQAEPKAADTPTHERITSEGGTAKFVETDVSVPGDVEAAVAAAREYGGVDVMVNNAGIHTFDPLVEVDVADFDRIHAVNSRGVFLGCQAAARDMLDRGTRGKIVNTASINSFLAVPDLIPYLSSKGAVRMITRGAALELAEDDIRVNAIAPGPTVTALGDDTFEERERRFHRGELPKSVPLERVAYPEDVVGAALFLASDSAELVTGELLVVDGGWSLY